MIVFILVKLEVKVVIIIFLVVECIWCLIFIKILFLFGEWKGCMVLVELDNRMVRFFFFIVLSLVKLV